MSCAHITPTCIATYYQVTSGRKLRASFHVCPTSVYSRKSCTLIFFARRLNQLNCETRAGLSSLVATDKPPPLPDSNQVAVRAIDRSGATGAIRALGTIGGNQGFWGNRGHLGSAVATQADGALGVSCYNNLSAMYLHLKPPGSSRTRRGLPFWRIPGLSSLLVISLPCRHPLRQAA